MEENLAQRVQALERRIADLEGSRTLRAPLRVVDDEGRTLLLVEGHEGGVRLFLTRPGRKEPFITLALDADGDARIALSDSSGTHASGLFVGEERATLQ